MARRSSIGFDIPCADKSLARPGRKKSYSDQTLTFASHLETIQNFVRPTRSPKQQRPPRQTKNGDLSIVFSVGSG